MKKTTVYLDRKTDRDLDWRAAAEGKSKAQVMREALADWVKETSPQPRITAIGVFEGPGDVADNVDRYLEGLGED
jgi:predicted transcriptional regulator